MVRENQQGVLRDEVLELGSISVFVVSFVIPFIFFVFCLVLDLTNYYSERQRFQSQIDEISVTATRFLPFEQEAARVAQEMLQAFPFENRAQIRTTSSSLSIEVLGEYPVQLGKFFGLDLAVPFTGFSRSVANSSDTVIVFDNSSYLAPDPQVGSVWGNGADWPSGFLFNYLQFRGNPSPQVLTQQCFNPAFSAMKQAAIVSFDFLSSFTLNRVGLVFSPGAFQSPVRARELLARSETVQPQGGEARFESASFDYSSNEYCGAIAERDTWPAYQLPRENQNLPGPSIPLINRPAYMIEAGSWSFDQSYAPYLLGREAIWSRAVYPSIGDFREVFHQAHESLLVSSAYSSRGAQSGVAPKRIVMFMGDVPWIEGQRFPDAGTLDLVRNEFRRAEELEVEIVYVLFPHQGNNVTGFEGRKDQLEALVDDFHRVRLIFQRNADDIPRLVSEYLMQLDRESLIAT